jgi:hypothetical protein
LLGLQLLETRLLEVQLWEVRLMELQMWEVQLLELQLLELLELDLLLLELRLMQLELKMPEGLAAVAQKHHPWLLLRLHMMVRSDLGEEFRLWAARPSPLGAGRVKGREQAVILRNCHLLSLGSGGLLNCLGPLCSRS